MAYTVVTARPTHTQTPSKNRASRASTTEHPAKGNFPLPWRRAICVYVVIWISVLALPNDTWWRNCKTDEKLRPSRFKQWKTTKNQHRKYYVCWQLSPSTDAFFSSPLIHISSVYAVFVACHFGIKSTYCYIYHPRSVLFTHRRLSSLFWYFLVWQTIHNRFPCQNPCHFPSLFLLSHTLLLSLSRNGASNFSQTLSIRKSSPRSPLYPKHSEYSSNWSK